MDSQLHQKLDQAKMVIEEALDTFSAESLLVAWSAGKDSTLLLRLILDVCRERKCPFPKGMDIDQKDAFEELIAFRDVIAAQWGVSLLIVRNSDVLDKVDKIGDAIQVENLNTANRQALTDIGFADSSLVWRPDSPACTHLLKNIPMMDAIISHRIKGLFTGIRWDEHGARQKEVYFSPREKPPHMRIHPLLHLTERDVWNAAFALDIPFVDLYRHGYRSISTKSSTAKPSDLPAWEQDLENTSEREGRDEEKEKAMEQLRAWGYM